MSDRHLYKYIDSDEWGMERGGLGLLNLDTTNAMDIVYFISDYNVSNFASIIDYMVIGYVL